MPVIAVAEAIEFSGSLSHTVQGVLPRDTTIRNKDVFGLTSNPDILVDVDTTVTATAKIESLRSREVFIGVSPMLKTADG